LTVLFYWGNQLELEEAQKKATETPAPAEAAAVTRTSLTEEETSSAAEAEKEKPAPTPDYAAGLVPSNPPPTPAPAPPTLTPTPAPLNPLKEAGVGVTRVVVMPSVRAPVPAATPAAAPSTPAQVVRLVTAQTATGAANTITTPTVYRLVQPAGTAAPGQVATVVPVTAVGATTAPPKKSVALMLTVSFRSVFLPFLNWNNFG